MRGRIQVSKETADLLIAAGKDYWLTPREDEINAKGKGILKTYWLKLLKSKKTAGSVSSGASGSDNVRLLEDLEISETASAELTCRVNWMTDLLTSHLQQILAHRASRPQKKPKLDVTLNTSDNLIAINEVVEVIQILPTDVTATVHKEVDPNSIKVDPLVVDQLQAYVTAIALMYKDNPFHNFSHCCRTYSCHNRCSISALS